MRFLLVIMCCICKQFSFGKVFISINSFGLFVKVFCFINIYAFNINFNMIFINCFWLSHDFYLFLSTIPLIFFIKCSFNYFYQVFIQLFYYLPAILGDFYYRIFGYIFEIYMGFCHLCIIFCLCVGNNKIIVSTLDKNN